VYLPSSVNCSLGVLCLITRSEGRPYRCAGLASELQVTENAVGKALLVLRHAGLIRNISGPKGGYVLTRSAAAISVGDVVALFARGVEVGDPVNVVDGHRLHHWFEDLWSQVNDTLQLRLSSISLAELSMTEIKGHEFSWVRDPINHKNGKDPSSTSLTA
jgi:Rrf2 family protein